MSAEPKKEQDQEQAQPVTTEREAEGATVLQLAQRAVDWTKERVRLVIAQCCPKGIGEDEAAMFIEQCKRTGLDPINKEAFCVARRENKGTRERPVWGTKYEFQPSEAGMLARAERFPDFMGIQCSSVYAEDEIVVDQGEGKVTHRFNPAKRKGSLVGAWARVARKGKLPIVVWLDFAGFVQQTPLWSKIPNTMIEKCARVAALRKAYPDAFGGLYVREEMPAEEYVDAHQEQAPAKETKPQQQAARSSAPKEEKAKPQQQGKPAGPPPPAAAKAQQQPAADLGPVLVFGGDALKGKPIRQCTDGQLVDLMKLGTDSVQKTPRAKWADAVKQCVEQMRLELEDRRQARADEAALNDAGGTAGQDADGGREPGDDDLPF